ncbi:MAG: flagellar basal body rod protein FlgC [Pseudomonadota bacterium]
MSLLNNFDVAGSAMTAQALRLNITTSNMANADTISGSAEAAYRSRNPVFQSLLMNPKQEAVGVEMLAVVESQAEIPVRHEPGHPLADADGNIYSSNVNVVEEMVNMLSASRSYQSNIEVLNTSKQLLLRTLTLGE